MIIISNGPVWLEFFAGTAIDDAVGDAIDFCRDYQCEALFMFNGKEITVNGGSSLDEKVKEYFDSLTAAP